MLEMAARSEKIMSRITTGADGSRIEEYTDRLGFQTVYIDKIEYNGSYYDAIRSCT
jgi:hypothetical protein